MKGTNCVCCGKFVDGTVIVNTKEGTKPVCNVKCAFDYIQKREKLKGIIVPLLSVGL